MKKYNILVLTLIILFGSCAETPAPMGEPTPTTTISTAPPVSNTPSHGAQPVKSNKPAAKPKPKVQSKPTNLKSGFAATFNWKKTGTNEFQEVELDVSVDFKTNEITLFVPGDYDSNSSNTLEIQNVHSNYTELSGDNFYSSFSTVLNPVSWEERKAKQYDFNLEVINSQLNYISISGNGMEREYYIQIPKESNSATVRHSVVEYVVKKGDTPQGIANRNGITLEKLRSQNSFRGNAIYPGQVLDVSK